MTAAPATWAGVHAGLDQVPFRRVFRQLRRPVPEGAQIVTAYTDGQVTFRSNRSKVGYHEAADLSKFQGVESGDFVVHGLDIMRGSVGVADSRGAISSVCVVCAPVIDVEPRYVAYLMRLQAQDGYPKALARGVREGGADFRRWDTLAELPIALPAISEQRRIADFLDDRVSRIDNIIAARRQQVATERARAVAERDRLVELAVVRGAVKVRYLVRKIEQGWSPQAESTPAEEGVWGVLKSGAVNGGSFRSGENKALPSELDPKTEYEIRAGDLLMSRASGSLDLIGSVAVAPDGVQSRLLLCDKIYRITPDRGVSPRFLAASLRTSRSRSAIRLGVSGAEGMANSLPSGVIRDLVVPRIAEVEQIELADRVENVEGVSNQRLHLLALSIELLNEYKQSLITAAVTGKFDVTTASTEVPG